MKKWANRNTNQKSPKRAQTKESGPRRQRGSTVNLANGSDDPNGSVRGSWQKHGSYATNGCKTQRLGEPIKGSDLQPTPIFSFSLSLSSLRPSLTSLNPKPRSSSGFIANPEKHPSPAACSSLPPSKMPNKTQKSNQTNQKWP